MKKLSTFMLGAMALGLWSCASDEPGGVTPAGQEGDVFATLTLQLPTRSATDESGNGDVPAVSTGGNEEGKDYENNVDKISVVLAYLDTDNSYKVIATSQSAEAIKNQTAAKPTYSITFKSEALESYADKNETNPQLKPIYVFAYCNPTTALQTKLDALQAGEKFTDIMMMETSASNLEIAKKTAFTMTNALITQVGLPGFQELIRNHNTQATAFPLGEVKVERLASRFDFQSKAASGDAPANNYIIKDNVSGLNAAYVEINGMSLFNEAREFYALPRMSSDATWNPYTICGYENPGVYVVSPNLSLKTVFAGGAALSTVTGMFNVPYSTLPGDMDYDLISQLGEADNDGWTGAAGTDYKIWRYATENTMPQSAQKHGITTGVVFRGEIKALPQSMWTGAEKPENHPARILANAMQAGETLYAYTNSTTTGTPQPTVMLGSATDIYKYAYTHNTSAIRTQFVNAVRNGFFTVTINGTVVSAADVDTKLFPETLENFNGVSVAGPTTNVTNDGQYNAGLNYGFMAYQPTFVEGQNHYYVYYYYYNRHNDNNRVDAMGIMEFATVRNNIYKLNVNTVGGFGTPGDIIPDPHDDDENPEVYFNVTCKVLDWVVRVNGIDL